MGILARLNKLDDTVRRTLGGSRYGGQTLIALDRDIDGLRAQVADLARRVQDLEQERSNQGDAP